jgi:hypothetical protein
LCQQDFDWGKEQQWQRGVRSRTKVNPRWPLRLKLLRVNNLWITCEKLKTIANWSHASPKVRKSPNVYGASALRDCALAQQ